MLLTTFELELQFYSLLQRFRCVTEGPIIKNAEFINYIYLLIILEVTKQKAFGANGRKTAIWDDSAGSECKVHKMCVAL